MTHLENGFSPEYHEGEERILLVERVSCQQLQQLEDMLIVNEEEGRKMVWSIFHDF